MPNSCPHHWSPPRRPSYPPTDSRGVWTTRDPFTHLTGLIRRGVRRFKLELFGRDDIILRTANITRNSKGFECLKNASFRQRFYARLNDLMTELDYYYSLREESVQLKIVPLADSEHAYRFPDAGGARAPMPERTPGRAVGPAA